jgi:hypothetical protein
MNMPGSPIRRTAFVIAAQVDTDDTIGRNFIPQRGGVLKTGVDVFEFALARSHGRLILGSNRLDRPAGEQTNGKQGPPNHGNAGALCWLLTDDEFRREVLCLNLT